MANIMNWSQPVPTHLSDLFITILKFWKCLYDLNIRIWLSILHQM